MSKKKEKRTDGLEIDGKFYTKEELLKSKSLEEVKDEAIGKVGTPERDTYETEFKEDDTTTQLRPTETQAPATNKEYSPELSKALVHIIRDENVAIGINFFQPLHMHLAWLTSEAKKVILNYPQEIPATLIVEMANRNFVVNNNDTKYLRIAVRHSTDWKMKDTILVFDRRK